MKSYFADAKCPKCGNENASTAYRVPGLWRINSVLTDLKKEVLIRTCLRCGYEWPEAVISE